MSSCRDRRDQWYLLSCKLVCNEYIIAFIESLTNVYMRLCSLKDSGICSASIDNLNTTSSTERMLKRIGRVSLDEG